jgi:signal transduction histidine kinase
LRIAVRDTGIGIAAGKQQEVFQFHPGRQLSIARSFGGSGLGLAISSIWSNCGGEIGSRRWKEGSLWFTLSLPVADSGRYRRPINRRRCGANAHSDCKRC